MPRANHRTYKGAGLERPSWGFDIEHHIKPYGSVLKELDGLWMDWVYAKPRNGRSGECNHRFTVTHTDSYFTARFFRNEFNSHIDNRSYSGTSQKAFTVYRDSIDPQGTIYKKRGMNR